MLNEIAQMFVRGKEIKCAATGETYFVVYQLDPEKRMYLAVKGDAKLPCPVFLVEAAKEGEVK